MTASVFVFPVVMRPGFGDPAWREQHNRECSALGAQLYAPPDRTRPLLVIDNPRQRARALYAAVLRDIAEIMREEA